MTDLEAHDSGRMIDCEPKTDLELTDVIEFESRYGIVLCEEAKRRLTNHGRTES